MMALSSAVTAASTVMELAVLAVTVTHALPMSTWRPTSAPAWTVPPSNGKVVLPLTAPAVSRVRLSPARSAAWKIFASVLSTKRQPSILPISPSYMCSVSTYWWGASHFGSFIRS